MVVCVRMRDLNFLPESQRGVFGIRRRCRKLIHERITALQGEAFFIII